MIAYDACFLAIAAGLLLEGSPRSRLAALAPVAAWGAALLPLGAFGGPLAALGIAALCPRFAAVALLLSSASYAGLAEAVLMGGVWLGGSWVLETLGARLDAEELPAELRGAPVRLLACGLLYYALHPLHYV